MQPHEIAPWVAVIRDLVLTIVPLIIGAVLKKKYGLEIDLKATQQRQALAQDGIGYAAQFARATEDIAIADGPKLKDKALQFVATQAPKADLDKMSSQIEAELGKRSKGVGSGPVVHAEQLVISSPSPVVEGITP